MVANYLITPEGDDLSDIEHPRLSTRIKYLQQMMEERMMKEQTPT